MSAGFHNEPLRDAIVTGAIRPDRTRLWLRSDRPGVLLVKYWPERKPDRVGLAVAKVPAGNESDNTIAINLPEPGADARPLEPLTRYRYRVFRLGGESEAAVRRRINAGMDEPDAVRLGEGRFETAPDRLGPPPARFALALMSCNQPFDADGAPKAESEAMLRAARACLAAHETKLVFTMGDQMYTDYPEKLSLFAEDYFPRVAPGQQQCILECSTAEVRRLLQDRYRHFWNFEGWRSLHADYPCYPILDDHELVDNWGSDPEHVDPPWRTFFEGARAAYFDYQGSRVATDETLPETFDYTVEYGPIGIFVLDLRSKRTPGRAGRIYSDEQEERLRGFLAESPSRQVLFLVLSVPPVHLPRWLARLGTVIGPRGEDFSDRWSTMGHILDRDRLFRLLHDHQRSHPEQRLVLLAGDIHLGCLHEIFWQDGTRPLIQFISSGITNQAGLPTRIAARLSIRWKRRLKTDCGLEADVRILSGERGANRNPYGKLNLGIVEFERTTGQSDLRMRFLLYGHHGDEPKCIFRSAWR